MHILPVRTFQTSYFPPFMVITYVLVMHSLNCLATALKDLEEQAKDLKNKSYDEKKTFIEEVDNLLLIIHREA